MLRLITSRDSSPALRSTTLLPTASIMVSSWLMRLFIRTPMTRKKIRQINKTPPVAPSNRMAFLWPTSVKVLNSCVALCMSLLAAAAAAADLLAMSAESRTVFAKVWYCWYALSSTLIPTYAVGVAGAAVGATGSGLGVNLGGAASASGAVASGPVSLGVSTKIGSVGVKLASLMV